MELESKLLSSFIILENQLNTTSDVHKIRNEAIQTFEKTGFPKKEESWKYTSLRRVLKNDFSIFPKSEPALEYSDVKPFLIHDIDSYKIIFINGVYSSHLSETTHLDMDICVMSAALTKSKYKPIIQKYFDKSVSKKDQLTTLNTAFSREGAYIHIPHGKEVEKPVQIVNFSTEPYLFAQPRNLIVLEDNARMQVIERHQNLTDGKVLSNAVTEVFLGKNADLDYYKIQNDTQQTSLVDNTYTHQQSSSNVTFHTFSFGGELVRNNLNFYQNGQRCNSTLKGITLTSETQHIDHHTLVHHLNPNCESHQDYKGVFGGNSTGVFNGKIVVDKVAQKINAYQQNDNILVNDKATVNTKPQLEIFADDVKCSHGCTVGQINEEALFYLNSRGIPKIEAKGLLLYAFSNSVMESVKIPELKEKLSKQIATKLSVNLNLIL